MLGLLSLRSRGNCSGYGYQDPDIGHPSGIETNVVAVRLMADRSSPYDIAAAYKPMKSVWITMRIHY